MLRDETRAEVFADLPAVEEVRLTEEDFPDPGPEPQFNWINKHDLVVDHRYQRSTESRESKARIRKIAMAFSWRKFQVIIVSPVEGGKFAILDGQHRVGAAMLHPRIHSVPCWVVETPEIEAQADTFVAVNRDRVKVHPIDLFHAQVAAGQEDAILMKEVTAAAGVKIPKSPTSSAALKPLETQAINAIRTAIHRFGRDMAEEALAILAEAWPDTAGHLRHPVIIGTTMLWTGYGHRIRRDRLVSTISEVSGYGWESKAKGLKDDASHPSVQVALMHAIRSAYNKGLKNSARLPELPDLR